MVALVASLFDASTALGVARAAEVGKAAPDFTLQDGTGQERSLSEFRGRFVVLEWLNPDCPFVRKHYDSGNMQRLQRTYTARQVAWLSINSSAPGNQGHMTPERSKAFAEERRTASTAILLDPDGVVGRLYGAKTTPHLFVIDPQGVLIYAGAIDDTPSTDPADVAAAVSYVERALEDAMADRPVQTAETTPYGCSVKYGR